MTDLRTNRGMHRATRTSDVLAHARSRALLEKLSPSIATKAQRLGPYAHMSIGQLLVYAGLGEQPIEAFLRDLAAVPAPITDSTERIIPSTEHEPLDVPIGSAPVDAPVSAEQWATMELRLDGPRHGNPDTDVELGATFSSGDTMLEVGGFHDGDGVQVIRFLPPEPGRWEWTTHSNARSLDGISGCVDVAASERRGPVRVAEDFHFAHAGGDVHTPIGTTAYAWTHQHPDTEADTLRSLADSPFNKIRMCVFPKHYDYNTDEPPLHPFQPLADGSPDPTRFNAAFFHHLERRVRDLDALGIQVDLILFHPYDRWGYAELGEAADDRYVAHLVRRLATFPNVWWSLANEWDFIHSKDEQDWERLGRLVRREDHVGHLLSIHNGVRLYDYSRDWITHASVQKTDQYRTTENVTQWRGRWHKPVVVDEFGYEGDVPFEWGNLPATELVRRFWEATIRGGYATHGETYWNPEERVFWSKGGNLVGESPARIAFLTGLMAEVPGGRLEPVPGSGRRVIAGVAGVHELTYLGNTQPREHTVRIPPGRTARIDIIDTWLMTIDPLEGQHSDVVTVPLPGRPWQAIRVRYDA